MPALLRDRQDRVSCGQVDLRGDSGVDLRTILLVGFLSGMAVGGCLAA